MVTAASFAVSSGHSLRVLVVEDAPTLLQLYRSQLQALGCRDIQMASTVMDAMLTLDQETFDVALVDIGLPDGSGFEVMDRLLQCCPECVIVVISGEDALDMAVEAAQAGAQDFLRKPFSPERLAITLRNTLHTALLKHQLSPWNLKSNDRFCGFIGRDERMHAVYANIEAIGKSEAPVYVHGESGTGKDIAAEAIWQTSQRAGKPYVPINCASIPGELIESELFGHIKGAFTGAHADRDGAFILADGGTLFLDEIADLDIKVQAKLLRVLQTGELRRLGESRTRRVNVRVISASHRNLVEMVRKGEFREDLFYRLHVVPLHLPPLRERGEDILLLAHHFLRVYAEQEGKQIKGFSRQAQALLLRHPWTGNVRELMNTIRAVVALNNAETIEADMIPERLSPTLETRQSVQAMEPITPLAELERREIERAMQMFGRNIVRASTALGIHPSTLHRKLKAYQMGGPVTQ